VVLELAKEGAGWGMLVDRYGSREITLPASSRPVLLQLSLWVGVCASSTGLSSICFTCLTLTCTHAGTLRLGMWKCTSPGWPAGCNFLSGLETEIRRLFALFYRKEKKKIESMLCYLNFDTFICTILKRICLQYVLKCLELGRLSQWI